MRRRFGAPTGIRAIEKQMKKQQKEFKIKVETKEWENAKPLEEIEVPEQFARSEALRLWFLARCNAQGTFDAMAPDAEMAYMRHQMMMIPVPRFWRRLGIALQLIPIIGPQVFQLVSGVVFVATRVVTHIHQRSGPLQDHKSSFNWLVRHSSDLVRALTISVLLSLMICFPSSRMVFVGPGSAGRLRSTLFIRKRGGNL